MKSSCIIECFRWYFQAALRVFLDFHEAFASSKRCWSVQVRHFFGSEISLPAHLSAVDSHAWGIKVFLHWNRLASGKRATRQEIFGRERCVILKYVRMDSVSIRNRIGAFLWIQLITYLICMMYYFGTMILQFPSISNLLGLHGLASHSRNLTVHLGKDGFRDSGDPFDLAMAGQIPGLLWHGSFVTKRLLLSHNDSSDRRGCCMMLLHLLSCHGFGWLYHRSLVTNDEDDERIILFWALAREFSYFT